MQTNFFLVYEARTKIFTLEHNNKLMKTTKITWYSKRKTDNDYNDEKKNEEKSK